MSSAKTNLAFKETNTYFLNECSKISLFFVSKHKKGANKKAADETLKMFRKCKNGTKTIKKYNGEFGWKEI